VSRVKNFLPVVFRVYIGHIRAAAENTRLHTKRFSSLRKGLWHCCKMCDRYTC